MKRNREDRESFYIGYFMALNAIAERPHLIPAIARPELIEHMVSVGVGAIMDEMGEEVSDTGATT